MTTILIGTDFSDAAEAAHLQGVHLAERLGADVVFAHVVPSLDLVTSAMQARYADTLGEALETLRARLQALVDSHGGPGLAAASQLAEGEPSHRLAEIAAELEAEAIVVATLGRTGLERFLLGSVAERVIRYAATKVLVARSQSSGRMGYRDILVPTDFSPAADRALEAAVQIAGADARIELMHCWQTPAMLAAFGGAAVMPGLEDEIRDEVAVEAQRRLDAVESDRVDIELSIHRGAPASEIQDKLAERAFDLVVMGSHGRTGVSRFLLGSVAERTVRHSPCSVMVVPPADKEATA